jgi:hypothetical protein
MLCRVVCWGETDAGETDAWGDKSASEYRHVVAMHNVWKFIHDGKLHGADFDRACYGLFGYASPALWGLSL